MAKRGWAPRHRPTSVEQRVDTCINLWGLQFASPIGLAAGFDKDGEVVQAMVDLGFSFVEVGTVTPLRQPGNAQRPRMWRLPSDLAIVNRYGFNSQGADAVRERLIAYRQQREQQQHQQQQQQRQNGSEPKKQQQPSSLDEAANQSTDLVSRASSFVRRQLQQWPQALPRMMFEYPHRDGVVGVNIGKNKDSTDPIQDYVTGIRILGECADFVVINVSSPNTTGLRDLQQLNKLEQLLRAVLAERAKDGIVVPVLVKLSPDMDTDQLQEVGRLCVVLGVDGIVMSNTTTTRPTDLVHWRLDPTSVGGGLSGAPLRDRSTEGIRTLFRATRGQIPIVGVGGVSSARDAVQKLKAGASLVQVYSAMVYHGPGLIAQMRSDLAQAVLDEGKRSVEELIGMDHEELYWERQVDRQAVRRRYQSRVVAEADVVATSSSSDGSSSSSSSADEPALAA
jgi:dihydroorotate dehydrogenase